MMRIVHQTHMENLCCAHSVKGTRIQGSPDVLANGQAVLRVGDPEAQNFVADRTLGTCWKFRNSLLQRIPAARVGDDTAHCGGTRGTGCWLGQCGSQVAERASGAGFEWSDLDGLTSMETCGTCIWAQRIRGPGTEEAALYGCQDFTREWNPRMDGL